uniref:cytochrome c oxidase subunit II n=1 Tax=Cyphonia clavata TaxID=104817 RepID=UPI0022FDA155|nr:cytochrome c oxidase subunit II [Cyphonia clavata]WAP90800.1 cytochrome c oxidase subunit II [Cyphonia clavata]
MNSWMNLSFQDACSPNMEQLIMFNDHAMMIIIMITSMVGYMMSSMMFNKFINRNLLEGQMMELIWTMTPAIMLIFIALPSLRILYLIEENMKPMMTIKAIGHQWYWSYEYSDFKNLEFESYMKPSNTMKMNEFRLMDVDSRTPMPFLTNIRMLTSSSDVIHSWTIPSLGIKIDACPGRINQANMMTQRPGIYYGQCSEICGANHSFMPIVIESLSLTEFIKWLKT